MHWDIFCKVIDNHGDAGVCWRLARELAERGERVRLWIDDPSMLEWMAPGGHAGVDVVCWSEKPPAAQPGDVVVEAFGCDPPAAFVAAMGQTRPAWINLEYLSAQAYAENSHGLPSPVHAGLAKHFFYPGFTPRTGGLLRERDLLARQAAFDRGAWLRALGVAPGRPCISLFCYEPPALAQLLAQLDRMHAQLLVTAGRAAEALRALQLPPSAHVHWLPLMSQREFDHLLWACDFNFVRGEDSLTRAILAGKPFVWQAYPQDDRAHHDKLDAFLHWLQPADELARLMLAWNGLAALADDAVAAAIRSWPDSNSPRSPRRRALELPELCESLLRFASERVRI